MLGFNERWLSWKKWKVHAKMDIEHTDKDHYSNVIMGILIDREHNKKHTKQKRYIQNKRDIKLPMFKMKI